MTSRLEDYYDEYASRVAELCVCDGQILENPPELMMGHTTAMGLEILIRMHGDTVIAHNIQVYTLQYLAAQGVTLANDEMERVSTWSQELADMLTSRTDIPKDGPQEAQSHAAKYLAARVTLMARVMLKDAGPFAMDLDPDFEKKLIRKYSRAYADKKSDLGPEFLKTITSIGRRAVAHALMDGVGMEFGEAKDLMIIQHVPEAIRLDARQVTDYVCSVEPPVNAFTGMAAQHIADKLSGLGALEDMADVGRYLADNLPLGDTENAFSDMAHVRRFNQEVFRLSESDETLKSIYLGHAIMVTTLVREAVCAAHKQWNGAEVRDHDRAR